MPRKAPLFLSALTLLMILAVCQWATPAQEMSTMENRILAAAPTFSLPALKNGTWTENLETFAADQLPLRDTFVSIHAASQALLGRRNANGVILGRDGWLFDRSDGWSERNARLNAAALQSLAEQTGKKAHLLIVPSSAAVYPEYVPAFAPLADENALLAAASEETNVLPLLDRMLSQRAGAPLFYCTDHHWTMEGAQIGYLTVCEALELPPLTFSETVAYPGFYGSYYARDPIPWLKSDLFSFIAPEGIRLVIDGEEKETLADPEALAGRDKYAALLWGNHPLIELINAEAPDKTLFVIKDSYANALLPALARHYRRIVAVDARYYAGDIVEAAAQYEGEDILCVYGINTLSSGRTIALLEGL